MQSIFVLFLHYFNSYTAVLALMHFYSGLRGCILYAMVCGRLPFGDDSQVAKNVTKQINFPVPLTEGVQHKMRVSRGCNEFLFPLQTVRTSSSLACSQRM